MMTIDVQAEINRLNYIEIIILKRNLSNVIRKSLSVIKPRPNISRIEFAEKHIILPDTFPIPGPFRIKNSPHLREIFEAMDDPLVRKITIMASSQIGKTLLMIIDWAYNVVYDPSNMLMQQPTKELTKSFVTNKLESIIDASPILRKKVAAKKKGRQNDSTTFYKSYIGGSTEILTAGAKGTGRQRSAKRVYSDDIDAVEVDKQTEGDPQSNLEKRTIVYKYDSFILEISVPGKEEESKIAKDYELSSKGKFTIKCPECGTEQSFEDERLDWVKDYDLLNNPVKHYPKTAFMRCANSNCNKTFNETERLEILQTGYYKHKHPDRYHPHAGFHLGQLMSTLSSLEYVATEKIKADEASEKGDDKILETYVEQVLGLPFKKVKAREVDAKALLDIREDYITDEDKRIPNEVLLITHGVDVQAGSGQRPGRLELEFWGWGKDEEGWIIDKKIFPGNPVLKSTWNKLYKYIKDKTFARKDGMILGCKRAGVDSGYEADIVYKYCANRFRSDGLMATKGANKYGAPLVPKKFTLELNGRTYLMNIGTQAAKTILFGRLDAMTKKGEDGQRLLRPGSKYLHFTRKFCDSEYFDQLTAEHGVIKFFNDVQYTIYKIKKKGLPNEALDLLVINYCIMRSLNPKWEAIEASLERKKQKLLETGEVESDKDSEGNNETSEPEVETQHAEVNNSINKKNKSGKKIRRSRNNFVSKW